MTGLIFDDVTDQASITMPQAEAPDGLVDHHRLLIVGGCPRSGTTLVQNMLDCHPAIYGGPEFIHLPDILYLRNRLQASVEKGLITAYVSSEDVDKAVRALTWTLLGAPAARGQARLVSEKTPGNCLHFPELLSLFPDAAAVHVVRDPRGVMASMLNVHQRHVDQHLEIPESIATVDAMIQTLTSHVLAGLAAARASPGRVMTLRYEDLLRDPERICRELCRHTGVDFDDTMLHPGRQRHDAEHLVRAGTPWYSLDEYRRDVDPSGAEAWRGHLMPEHHLALLQALTPTRDTWHRLGYDL